MKTIFLLCMAVGMTGCSEPVVGEINARVCGDPFKGSVTQRVVLAVQSGYVQYRADYSDGVSKVASCTAWAWKITRE
jgi:hypothetical protein